MTEPSNSSTQELKETHPLTLAD